VAATTVGLIAEQGDTSECIIWYGDHKLYSSSPVTFCGGPQASLGASIPIKRRCHCQLFLLLKSRSSNIGNCRRNSQMAMIMTAQTQSIYAMTLPVVVVIEAHASLDLATIVVLSLNLYSINHGSFLWLHLDVDSVML
jgi:hypothetical protein